MGLLTAIARTIGLERRTAALADSYGDFLQERAADAGAANPLGLATAESAIAFIARCVSMAQVRPVAPFVSHEFLRSVVLDMLRSGNSIWLIDNLRGQWRFERAADAEITGGPDPRSWRYLMDFQGPTQLRRTSVSAASVLHFRYMSKAGSPWRGVSPMACAAETSALAANLERSLRDITSMPTGGLIVSNPDLSDSDKEGIRAGLKKARGNLALAPASGSVPSLAGGVIRDQWLQRNFGPMPNEQLAVLREQVDRDILAIFGVPQQLLRGGEGSQEDARRFLHTTLRPLGVSIASELTAKVRPMSFSFSEVAALDVRNRAQAFGALVTAGLQLPGGFDPVLAAEIAGVEYRPNPAAGNAGQGANNDQGGA